MRGERMLTGRMIGEKSREFGADALPTGLYFVKITGENFTETLKLIKTK